MKVVHKYEIGFAEARTVMPADAEIVHVEAIAGQMYVWAITAEPGQGVTRQIGYFATGEEIPQGAEYVGTGISEDRAFVWHVFSLPSPDKRAAG